MRAKEEYRDRDEAQVAILDALADRHEAGMTVFELRAMVDDDIDTLESALTALKTDDLIEVSKENGRMVIIPKDDVIDNGEIPDEDSDLFEEIRRRFPF